MQPEILFYIYSFPISKPLLFTWIIMAVLVLVSVIFTRNLTTIPKGPQHFLEVVVDGIENLVLSMIGDQGKPFIPLILMVALYVFLANLIGVIPGAFSPTEDLTTTVTLAAMVYVIGHAASIRKQGLWSWIKGFFQPYWFLFPINIVGDVAQVLSHSFRLYGNIFGGGILLGIVYMLVPYVVPVPLLAWFGVIMGFIQTAVFTMLAIVYIQMKVG